MTCNRQNSWPKSCVQFSSVQCSAPHITGRLVDDRFLAANTCTLVHSAAFRRTIIICLSMTSWSTVKMVRDRPTVSVSYRTTWSLTQYCPNQQYHHWPPRGTAFPKGGSQKIKFKTTTGYQVKLTRRALATFFSPCCWLVQNTQPSQPITWLIVTKLNITTQPWTTQKPKPHNRTTHHIHRTNAKWTNNRNHSWNKITRIS